MKKLYIFVVLILGLLHNTNAQEKTDSSNFYIGINLFAPITAIPTEFTKLYLPIASNLETGLALNTGIYYDRNTIELRASYGNPNKLFRLFQIHTGYYYLLSKNRLDKFYIGSFVKYYNLKNKKNNLINNSLIPYLCVGYKVKIKSFMLDFRINQDIYAISWSNQLNTTINSDFHFSVYDDISPVLPYFSLNIEYILKR